MTNENPTATIADPSNVISLDGFRKTRDIIDRDAQRCLEPLEALVDRLETPETQTHLNATAIKAPTDSNANRSPSFARAARYAAIAAAASAMQQRLNAMAQSSFDA